jgi:hypothetical protein
VPEFLPPAPSPAQVARLESLLRAGFQFVTFEKFARYLGVEKEGFVALLDISGDRVRQFGNLGFHMGSGIGVLIERSGKKGFVWKEEFREATPELLAAYASVNQEVQKLLSEAVA